jgi:type I restriction enzyme M protein
MTVGAAAWRCSMALPRGLVPMVSCGDENNGICGYFDVQHAYSHKLTIAFNGMNTLTAKYHPYQFAAKDDVAVCSPKRPLRLTTQLFIQVMLAREQWRFSYYRKCFKDKLERVTIPMPAKGDQIDEKVIERLMQTTPYWEFLKDRLNQSADPATQIELSLT